MSGTMERARKRGNVNTAATAKNAEVSDGAPVFDGR